MSITGNLCSRCSQSDIVGINDIFRDLATLVNEQGDVIGKSETSVILFVNGY